MTPDRIAVVGSSGSGKTTVARKLSRLFGLPHLELDAIYNLPQWQERDREEMRTIVDAFTAGDRWIVDGNYAWLANVTWERAQLVIVLSLPRSVVMQRVVVRTFWRAVTRKKLWNGNVEPIGALFSVKRRKSMIVWAWKRFEHYRRLYEHFPDDPRWAHVHIVRLTRMRDVRRFLRQTALEARGRSSSDAGRH